MKHDEMEEGHPDWNLEEWEEALTLRVGTAYGCRRCGNVVMVSKGGVGILDLVCCAEQMREMNPRREVGS
jgi:desulfoferrodoxin-like iron-binding protein